MSVNYLNVDLTFIFSDTSADHWWNRFLKPGFRHMFIMRKVEGYWLVLSPQVGFTDVDLVPDAPLDQIITLPRYTVLHCRFSRAMNHRVPHLFQPFTCVEQAKAMAGIRNPLIVTPWQFYRYVKKWAI